MKETLNVVLSYVKCALNNKKCETEILDDKLFYLIVRENGLSGLVYHAIIKENVTQRLYKALFNDFLAYVKADTHQLQLIDKLNSLFNENQIEHYFLKGSILKKMYPESYMRAMGDIDVLINDKDIKKIHKLLKQNEIKLVSRSPQHDVFETVTGLNIEIHPGFVEYNNHNYTNMLSSVFNYTKDNKLNNTYELVYLTYHLAKHFYSGGVGIRSILDIGIYYNYYKDVIDEELLIRLANETNSFQFIKTILKLNEELFDIKTTFKFMKTFEISNNTIDETIAYITKSGIHGWGSDFNPFSARVLKEEQKGKKRGKLGLILSRAFPKYREMKEIYPVLKKVPILLPIFWIVRLFKLIFLRGRTNLKKIKEIQKVDNVNETKSLFNEIGL